MVISSNLKEKAAANQTHETPEQLNIRRTLEFIWNRISERFKTISPAFRFFDLNADGKITFEQFVRALETLKVKLSSKDLGSIFSYLDEG